MFGAALGAALLAGAARADDNTVTIGLILPMTGPSASTGKQERAAAELYMHAAWRHGRGQEDQSDRQGRHRRGRRHQAPRRRADRQRSRQRADGLRPDAAGAGRRAGRDGGEGPEIVTAAGDRDDHREIALYRAHLVHPAAGLRADGRLGAEERDQEGRHHRHRLRPGHRRREMVRGHVREGRRNGRREDPRAAEEPGFRALPAAGEGRRARRGVRLRAVGPRRDLHEGVRRARPRQVGRSS